jgi:hypothetical protein
VSHRRIQALAFATVATLTLYPATAQTPIYLSANPPKVQLDEGPSLSLGRVGLDPCPDNFCRPEPQGNLFYFMTKGTHRIEPVPGIVLTIPLGNGGH